MKRCSLNDKSLQFLIKYGKDKWMNCKTNEGTEEFFYSFENVF